MKIDKYNYIINNKFSYWTALGPLRLRPNDKYRVQVKCKCICGKISFVNTEDLLRKKSTNCGCKRKPHSTHGMAHTNSYRIWSKMKDRCTNKKSKIYKWYGGRGIKVCYRWLKFENFYADMGERPKNKTLDRIDNNGPYCPENCRWATIEEQHYNTSRNKFYEYKGQSLTLTQIAKMFNFRREQLHRKVVDRKQPLLQAIDDILFYKKTGKKIRRNQII